MRTNRKPVLAPLRCRGRPPRRGSVLVAALVCMLVVMMILGSMFQGVVRARRQLHRERDLRQTELLLQAGCDRAAFQLSNADDYHGETWNLPADMVVGAGRGRVTIETTRSGSQPVWEVKVVAEYPQGSETSIRRSRTFQLPIQVHRQ
jgi:Tfp pilus assembly protein PilX